MKIEQPPQRTLFQSIVVDGSVLVGFGLLTYGAWSVFPPAGIITAGALMLAFGVFGARR